MLAGDFDYKTAAGLHRDRLAEAESIRRARKAKIAAKKAAESAAGSNAIKALKYRIGRQLIAIGERMTA